MVGKSPKPRHDTEPRTRWRKICLKKKSVVKYEQNSTKKTALLGAVSEPSVSRLRAVCEASASRLRGVCEASASRLLAVCEPSARRLQGVWEASASRLRGVCEASARRLQGVCEASATFKKLAISTVFYPLLSINQPINSLSIKRGKTTDNDRPFLTPTRSKITSKKNRHYEVDFMRLWSDEAEQRMGTATNPPQGLQTSRSTRKQIFKSRMSW